LDASFGLRIEGLLLLWNFYIKDRPFKSIDFFSNHTEATFLEAEIIHLIYQFWHYVTRGSSSSLPANNFFSGGRPTFSEAQKTPKKQTDAKQREALFSPR